MDRTSGTEPIVCHSPVVHVTQVGRGQAVGISATWISGTPKSQADGPAPRVERAAAARPVHGHGGQAAPAHPPEDQVLVPVHGDRAGRRWVDRHDDCPRCLSAKRTGVGGRFPVRLAALRQ